MEYTAKLLRFTRLVPPLDLIPDQDPVEIVPSVTYTTRWCVTSDETGEPLPGEGTGPAVLGDYVQSAWDSDRPTPWFAREHGEQPGGQPHRDPIEQVIDRVRQERGILHLGKNLTYDLSVWRHDSVMVLTDVAPGVKGWRCTNECKRCGLPLQFLNRWPWWALAADAGEECHGTTWVP